MKYYLNRLLKNGSVCMQESQLSEFKRLLESKNIKYSLWFDDVEGCEVDLK